MTIEIDDVFHEGHNDPMGRISELAPAIFFGPFQDLSFLNNSFQIRHNISSIV
jgi:hypothetical protein